MQPQIRVMCYRTKIGKAGNNFRREGANMADGREDYRNFMARVKAKRTSLGDNAGHGKGKKTKKGIKSIVVQRVNTQPTGKLKKFEPLDSRDFVDFSNYDSLTLKTLSMHVSYSTELQQVLAMYCIVTEVLLAP